jgi:hypothetical protein
MANFLVTTASAIITGTTGKDAFDLRKLDGVKAYGLDATDTFSATTVAGSKALLNGGAGDDKVILTGALAYQGSVFAGAGADTITADRIFSAAILRGGSGDDKITLKKTVGNTLTKTTVNGNDGADTITGFVVSGGTAGFIGGGKGKDVISLVFSGSNADSVKGGFGHDKITLSAAGSLSSIFVAGGNGFDTISFKDDAALTISANANINGDDQADRMIFSSTVTTTVGSATIGGGAGADTIQFAGDLSLFGGYLNGGAGNDSIYISALFSAGTLNGGAGADTISLGTFAVSGSTAGIIIGDAQADKFNLGQRDFTGGANGGNSGGSILTYKSFDQSNLAATDVVSAGFTTDKATGTLFTISQSAVSLALGAGGNTTTFTATDGIAVFTSTFDATLTARVSKLDDTLTKGQVVAFTNAGATEQWIFVQGGTAGTSDDLLVSVETAIGDVTLGGTTAIQVRNVAG